MIKVGITGGIGSGKSVVSDVIRLLGYPVYNSDIRAKELSDTNPIIRQSLVALFGPAIYTDNHLNRPLLASHLFQNSSHREAVNAIIHPVVFADFDPEDMEVEADCVVNDFHSLVEKALSHFFRLSYTTIGYVGTYGVAVSGRAVEDKRFLWWQQCV